MRKLASLLLAIFIPLLLVAPSISAQEFANQEDINAVEDVQRELSEFSANLDNPNISREDFASQASETVAAIDALLARGFFIASFGPDYTAAGQAVKDAALVLREDILKAESLIVAGDQVAYQAYLDEYNGHIDSFNQAVEQLNNTVNRGNEQTQTTRRNANIAMLIPFLLSLAMTIGLFFWAKAKSIDERLRRGRERIAQASIAPTVGLGITALTYVFAESLDRRYTVVWGLVVIGVFFLAKYTYEYQKLRRHVVSENK